MPKTIHPPWSQSVVQAVCKVLASTNWPGLTNSEIDLLLQGQGIELLEDLGWNKRDRLLVQLMGQQAADGAANCVIRFINDAMAPARYVEDRSQFDALRDALSEVLSLVGLKVNEKGEVAKAPAAATLDEVAKLAGRLQNELKRRGVHQQVMHYCEEEILRKSVFHAVFEATKGVAERLRDMTGSTLDGADLVDHCFSTKVPPPVVRINNFRTETEVSEHKGFANMLKGVFGTFRNPPAHSARAAGGWKISESDALDLFSLLSYLHRKLDGATVQPRT
jgi:uncharacterized protein (TIGR02391 family)